MQKYKVTKKRIRELIHAWIKTKHSIYSSIRRTTDALDYAVTSRFLDEMKRVGVEVYDDEGLRELVHRIMPRAVFFADQRGFVKIIPIFITVAFEKERTDEHD